MLPVREPPPPIPEALKATVCELIQIVAALQRQRRRFDERVEVLCYAAAPALDA